MVIFTEVSLFVKYWELQHKPLSYSGTSYQLLAFKLNWKTCRKSKNSTVPTGTGKWKSIFQSGNFDQTGKVREFQNTKGKKNH